MTQQTTYPMGQRGRRERTVWDWFILVSLIILSVVAATIIVRAILWIQIATPPQTVDLYRDLITRRQFKQLVDDTQADRSFVGRALAPSLLRAPSFSAMKATLDNSTRELTAEQTRHIDQLVGVGIVGLLLGLLGTVGSLMHAARASSGPAAGQSMHEPGRFAVEIRSALSHSAFGLIFGIVTMASYAILHDRVTAKTAQGTMAADDLLLMVKPKDPPPE